MLNIGERIKQVRKEQAGISQDDFANLLGMSQSHLSLIESEKSLPGSYLLYRIHGTFDIDLNWLLTGNGNIK